MSFAEGWSNARAVHAAAVREARDSRLHAYRDGGRVNRIRYPMPNTLGIKLPAGTTLTELVSGD